LQRSNEKGRKRPEKNQDLQKSFFWGPGLSEVANEHQKDFWVRLF